MAIDIEALRTVIMLCKDADITDFKYGPLAFSFAPPAPQSAGFAAPPRLAGKVVREEEGAVEEVTPQDLPPAYRALFPKGAPRRRGE